jgi:hypothetical protein
MFLVLSDMSRRSAENARRCTLCSRTFSDLPDSLAVALTVKKYAQAPAAYIHLNTRPLK